MSYDPSQYGFSTNQIHAGRALTEGAAPLQTPIYQTSTFIFDSTAQGAARFAGEEAGYIYTRLRHPNSDEVAARIAALEGGEDGLLLASGMGAITATIYSIISGGDHIVADANLYGCTYSLLTKGLPRFGVKSSLIDLADLDQLRAALTPETKLVYFETATNPNMKVVDIDAISEIAHAYNPEIVVMVDNTFASPYLVRPLKHGADVVIHSVTKYLNGHGDVIAGCIISTKEMIAKIVPCGLQYMTGACIGPMDAFLIGRGMKTLDIRMDRHCANAMKVARFLESHPAVAHVDYPGLESHPSHERAKKLYEHGGFGGILSFSLKCGRARAAQFVEGLKVCTLAVSLGDAFTLIEHPASMTHSAISPEDLAAVGIGESMMRLSVGLEDAEDIIADLKRELDKI